MNIRRIGTAAVTGAALAAMVMAVAPASAAPATGAIEKANNPWAPGMYMVKLKAGTGSTAGASAVESAAASLAAKYNGELTSTFTAVTQGFGVEHMSEADAKRLAADPAVRLVREVGTMRASGAQDEQPNPTWGLDRVDQRDRPLDKKYVYNATGEGVTIYDIDSGVNKDHPDFEGRASYGYDFLDKDNDSSDCHGHGSHTAGTTSSKTYGVAKKAKLVALRVLGCGGSAPDIHLVEAVEWITKSGVKPSVANISIIQDKVGVGDEEIQASIRAGYHYVVSANNQNADACNSSPARVPEVITVGNSTDQDGKAGDSNWGTCVDLFAPGSNITSLARSGSGTNTMSGTSMAAPHVTGAAALYLQSHPNASQAEVSKAIVDAATSGKITNPGSGTPNKLLYTKDFGGGGNPGPTCGKQSNGDDVSIPDAGAAVTSTIKFSGCGGSGATSSSVEVAIAHPYRGDVSVDLIAPSGKVYSLKTADPSDSAANVNQTFTVNLAGEAKDGDWKLSVKDAYKYDSGKIDSWSLTV